MRLIAQRTVEGEQFLDRIEVGAVALELIAQRLSYVDEGNVGVGRGAGEGGAGLVELVPHLPNLIVNRRRLAVVPTRTPWYCS